MSGQYTNFGNSRAIVGVAVTNIVVGTMIYAVDGTDGTSCGLLRNAGWLALELLRAFLQVPHWTAASAYLYEGPRLLQHLFETAVTLVPLVSVLAR